MAKKASGPLVPYLAAFGIRQSEEAAMDLLARLGNQPGFIGGFMGHQHGMATGRTIGAFGLFIGFSVRAYFNDPGQGFKIPKGSGLQRVFMTDQEAKLCGIRPALIEATHGNPPSRFAIRAIIQSLKK